MTMIEFISIRRILYPQVAYYLGLKYREFQAIIFWIRIGAHQHHEIRVVFQG